MKALTAWAPYFSMNSLSRRSPIRAAPMAAR